MVAGILVAFTLVCTIGATIYSVVAARPLEESWSEIAIGVAVVVAVGLAFIRWRTTTIAGRLASGRRLTATVEQCIVAEAFAHLRVSYTLDGRAVSRTLLLGAFGRASALRDQPTVTLAIDPAQPTRCLVVDLYAPDAAAR